MGGRKLATGLKVTGPGNGMKGAAESVEDEEVRRRAAVVAECRRRAYERVELVEGKPLWECVKNEGLSMLPLFALTTFLATPPGMWVLTMMACAVCGSWSYDMAVEWVKAQPISAAIFTTVFMSVSSIGSFIPLARYWDLYYASKRSVRCQTDKEHSVEGLWSRSEVRLSVSSLIVAAMMTSFVGITHILYGWDGIYFEPPPGYIDLLAQFVLYFLWIDIWAYFSHRALHLPFLYKSVHKWHHAYRQPTAFASLGLHPVDLLMIQGGVYLGLYMFRLHISCIVAVIVYLHYFNVVDHSGVYHESWLPWQPTSLYHDDHHKYWHCNYGQALTAWDRLFGTFYRERQQYTEKTFSY